MTRIETAATPAPLPGSGRCTSGAARAGVDQRGLDDCWKLSGHAVQDAAGRWSAGASVLAPSQHAGRGGNAAVDAPERALAAPDPRLVFTTGAPHRDGLRPEPRRRALLLRTLRRGAGNGLSIFI